MKSRLLPILCLVTFVAVAVYLLGPWREVQPGREDPSSEGASAGPGEKQRRTGMDVVKPQAEPPAEPVVMQDMVALAEQLNNQGATVEEDLDILQELIRVYTRYIGTVPEGGLNDEIVQGLLGENRMKMIFLARGHDKINERGELVDRFGTPYDFHPVSSELLEIRSAGPDQVLETPDDVSPQ